MNRTRDKAGFKCLAAIGWTRKSRYRLQITLGSDETYADGLELAGVRRWRALPRKQ